MRILHIVEVADGGVVSYVRDLCVEQVRRGHEVEVLVPPGTFDLDGVRVHSWAVDRQRPIGFRKARQHLAQVVAWAQSDVVHLHSFFPGLLGRRGARRRANTSGAVVYQPHAWALNATDSRWCRRAIVTWERWAAAHTDAIACVSTDEAEECQRYGISQRPRLIGSSVDVERFHPVDEETKGTWRQRLGVRQPRMLVCVGRLCRQKGQDRLVQAWSENPLPETELVLVGPGEQDSLVRIAGDQWERTVRAVGPQRDVRPWLWASDLAVLASRYEANSLAIAEALACGRPVATTTVGGARDAVGRWRRDPGGGTNDPERAADPIGPAGCVVGSDDVAGLLAECRRRLDNPELRGFEGRNARSRAVASFSAVALGDRVDALYAGCVPAAARKQRAETSEARIHEVPTA